MKTLKLVSTSRVTSRVACEQHRNNKSDGTKIKFFVYGKWCHQESKKATHRMGENLSTCLSDKRIMSRIYRKLLRLNNKKDKQPNSKSRNNLNTHFSKNT